MQAAANLRLRVNEDSLFWYIIMLSGFVQLG